VDLIKFVLFIVNFLCFLTLCGLLSGTVYLLLDGENTFLGTNITPSLSQDDPTNATYFSFIIITLILLSFLVIFTCLGCCGAAYKSGCMLGSFIVILFVLFGGSVGAVVFLHTQYGGQAVLQVLIEEMSRSLLKYREENRLTTLIWDKIQPTFACCGVKEEKGWKAWAEITGPGTGMEDNWKVPRACCRPEFEDCMYEPDRETAYLETGCAPRIVVYVQCLLYGVPILMFLSLVSAFVVSTSVTKSERRRKAQAEREYSVGAEEDFHHQAYPTAPVDNQPYNPGYYDHQDVAIAFPRAGYQTGGVGVYSPGPIGGYPTGTVPPPGAHMPLLHQAPPSYNEAVYRK